MTKHMPPYCTLTTMCPILSYLVNYSLGIQTQPAFIWSFHDSTPNLHVAPWRVLIASSVIISNATLKISQSNVKSKKWRTFTKSEIMQSERSISLLNLFHQNLQSEFIKVLPHPLLYSPEWWLSLSKKTLLIYSWRVEGGIWKRTNVKSKLRISRDSHLCGNTLPVFFCYYSICSSSSYLTLRCFSFVCVNVSKM